MGPHQLRLEAKIGKGPGRALVREPIFGLLARGPTGSVGGVYPEPVDFPSIGNLPVLQRHDRLNVLKIARQSPRGNLRASP
jgi:hypothetical protein